MSISNAFQILSNLQQQAIASNELGERLVTHSSASRGMGFIINGERFFCDADLVREVAVPQDLILVPQSKAWMRGIFNSKGVLFSVVDLGMLAGMDRPVVYQRGHLMILRHASRQCSLLVNRVVGFRNFDFAGVGQREPDAQTNEQWWESLSAFMGKSVHEGGETWRYIDIQKLIDSEVFLEVQ
jgi:chemotaxis signal transduction protein